MAFPQAAKSGYTLEDLAQIGPDEVTRRKKLAEALIAQSAGIRDIRSPLQGMAQMAEALVGRLQEARAARAEREGQAGYAAKFGRAVAGYDFGSPPAATPAAATSGTDTGNANYRDAIAANESGGNYQAIGPVTKSGDRAFGKYQVMGENIGPWTEQALGKRMSTQEFLANPDAQDKTFDHIFNGYVRQFGPEGAAQAWFGGPGSVGKTARRDILGTSVGDYGKNFLRNAGPQASMEPIPNSTTPNYDIVPLPNDTRGRQSPGSPYQPMVASLDPSVGMPPDQPVQTAGLRIGPIDEFNGSQAAASGSQAAALPPQAPMPAPGRGLPPNSAIIRALLGQPNDPNATGVGAGPFPAAPDLNFPAAPPAPGAGGTSVADLMTLASDPWASPGQQRMVEMLLGQRLKQSDPGYQMEQEKARLELDALRNPKMTPYQEAQLAEQARDDERQAAAADRAAASQETTIANTQLDNISGLRKEVQGLPSYKNISQAAPVYRSMVETAGRDTKASDLTLVYGLAKIMDPGSVVREGEVHMANDTQGMADYLNGIIKGIQGEGRLTPEGRQALMQEAFSRIQAFKSQFDTDIGMYRGIVDRNKFNPADVIPDFGTFDPWSATPAATGITPPAGASDVDELVKKYRTPTAP